MIPVSTISHIDRRLERSGAETVNTGSYSGVKQVIYFSPLMASLADAIFLLQSVEFETGSASHRLKAA